MVRRALALCLVGVLSWPTPSGGQAKITDPDILRGIKQLDEGEYDGAIFTLDAAARRLAADPAKAWDLSQAYLHLGIAYVGKGQEAAARARFRDALAQMKDLSLSPEKYPPKVIDLFEAAKEEQMKAGPSPAPTKEGGGGHKGLLIGLGVAAAVGGGIAAASGGKSTPPSPTPTPMPLKTDSYGPITLTIDAFCQNPAFNVFPSGPGTLTATLTWKETYTTLQMALFGDANSASNGTNALANSNQTSNTSAMMSATVTQKQYYLGVCHAGNSCAGSGLPSPCSATFNLTVTHP